MVDKPRVWNVECVDWRGRPAHVHITVSDTDAANIAIIAPAGESFTLDARQAERFQNAYDEARALAAEIRERRLS